MSVSADEVFFIMVGAYPVWHFVIQPFLESTCFLALTCGLAKI